MEKTYPKQLARYEETYVTAGEAIFAMRVHENLANLDKSSYSFPVSLKPSGFPEGASLLRVVKEAAHLAIDYGDTPEEKISPYQEYMLKMLREYAEDAAFEEFTERAEITGFSDVYEWYRTGFHGEKDELFEQWEAVALKLHY